MATTRPGYLALVLLFVLALSPGSAIAADELSASDLAAAAGIFKLTNDQDSNTVVFDYDRDGVSDLILSRHQLFGTEIFRGHADGTFTLTQTLPPADRHGCDSADFNADGLLDFYCAVGAEKGTTNDKANELWLQDPYDHEIPFHKVDGAWGAADPAGRGRDVAAFDANGDQLVDLFVGNTYGKLYPSPNRLFLNTGGGFTEQRSTAINKSGGICVAPADFDSDGDTDIFVCGTPNHLLRRNADGSYTDVGKTLGLSVEAPSKDADWHDYNRDGRPDLVQVSAQTLRVFYSTGTSAFTLGYSRPLVNGSNAALADVDLDGDKDAYVVEGRDSAGANAPDLLLLAGSSGTSFEPWGGLPQAQSGGGSNVAVIPDHLGRPALVVTNGAGGGAQFKGPRQLLVFGPPINRAPQAIDDELAVTEDVTGLVDVLSNDSDPDGDPLHVESSSGPAHGTVTVSAEGMAVYTPDPNYAGLDRFTYTVADANGATDIAAVTVLVAEVNDPPAPVPDMVTTLSGVTISISVLANDSDPDGDVLTVEGYTQPSHGSVVDKGDGTLTYTPSVSFAGMDALTYTVSDGRGGHAEGSVSIQVAAP